MSMSCLGQTAKRRTNLKVVAVWRSNWRAG